MGSTPIDVVICVGPHDEAIIYSQVQFTRRNVVGLKDIYLIASRNDLMVPGCTTIPESVFPFQMSDVKRIHGENPRNGWYLQQLLKLYAGFVVPAITDFYLVVDADTFFLRPTRFFRKDGKALYNYSRERHPPYMRHMRDLLPGLKKVFPRKSGITHHMIFKRDIVRDLTRSVENAHEGKRFYEVFLGLVRLRRHSGASEYEIYFNYVFTFHREQVALRPLSWDNNTVRPPVYSQSQTVEDGPAYVSCHHYKRVDNLCGEQRSNTQHAE